MKITFDKKKNKIQIIAPASKSSEFEKLKESLSKFFEEKGYNLIVSDDLFSEDSMPFHSNSDEYRYQDLKKALDDKEVKILWCIRGGYGSIKVGQKFLNSNFKLEFPKILIGFSDITSLHFLFNNQFLIPSIHGAHANNIIDEKRLQNIESILQILEGSKIQYCLSKLNNVIYDKIQDTKITGGNLTVICSNIGVMIDKRSFDNKILFLEDIDEPSYKIDRCLTQLFLGGFLSEVKAVIFGQFTKCDEYIDTILRYFIDNYCNNIPVFKVDYIGHDDINKPLIFGSDTRIESDILYINNPFNRIT